MRSFMSHRLFSPISMSSGFWCLMAKTTDWRINWKESGSSLKRPWVQYLITFYTSLKNPSLNSGYVIKSFIIIESVGLQRWAKIGLKKFSRCCPSFFRMIAKSMRVSESLAFASDYEKSSIIAYKVGKKF